MGYALQGHVPVVRTGYFLVTENLDFLTFFAPPPIITAPAPLINITTMHHVCTTSTTHKHHHHAPRLVHHRMSKICSLDSVTQMDQFEGSNVFLRPRIPKMSDIGYCPI